MDIWYVLLFLLGLAVGMAIDPYRHKLVKRLERMLEEEKAKRK